MYYILCVASIDTRCYTYVNQDSNPHIWSAKSILKGINADNNVIHSHVYIAIEFFTSNKVVTLKMDDICRMIGNSRKPYTQAVDNLKSKLEKKTSDILR